jgi:hypothetical protein
VIKTCTLEQISEGYWYLLDGKIIRARSSTTADCPNYGTQREIEVSNHGSEYVFRRCVND